METTTLRFVIMFEEGFWVGYFERSCAGELTAARHVFGADPSLAVLTAFVHSPEYCLLLWTRTLSVRLKSAQDKNPKRLTREIARSMHDNCAVSKARQAVQAEHEARKVERKSARSVRKALAADARFVDRRELRKRKRRGH